MTPIQILKRYNYKGLNICVRLLGGDVIEYLIAYKGSIYTQSYDRHSHKHKLKEIGAATLIVCNAAEQVADLVLQQKSKFYKLKKWLGLTQKVATTEQNTNNEKERISQGQGPGPRDQGPPQAPEPNREVGQS